MVALTPMRLVLVVTVALVVYFGVTAASNAIDGYRLDSERATIEREIATLESQHGQLLALRDYLESDEYVETVARRELGLVMPGQSAVVVVSPARTTPANPSGDTMRWWERLIAQ